MMPTKLRMKVTSVSNDPPLHMGGYSRTPFRVPNAPIFLSLYPSEERFPGGGDNSERLLERPVEKVRIKTENEGERDAQIIRPMIGPALMSMNPPIPTTIMLTMEEFTSLGKPTIGDEVMLTFERV
jgi:hypothetical protein